MTPEEKAVVQAAILERSDLGRMFARTELTLAVDALIRACPSCNRGGHVCPGDGNGIAHGETDCGQHDDEDPGDLKQWPASDCLNCDPLLAGASSTRVDGTGAGEVPRHCDHDLDWLPAIFGQLLPGDLARIGTMPARVTRVHRGQWHAKDRQWIDDAGKVRDHMTLWEHEELRIDLTANPGMHVYPPDTACEILAGAERAAILALQAGFPGTQPVDK